MRRTWPFLSVVLLTLWFSATQHCALASVGLLPPCPLECVPGQPCPKDGCDTIENGSYKAATEFLKAPAPDITSMDLLPFLAAALAGNAAEPLPEFSASADSPLNWVPTWNFVRRTAPPSRAPTLLV